MEDGDQGKTIAELIPNLSLNGGWRKWTNNVLLLALGATLALVISLVGYITNLHIGYLRGDLVRSDELRIAQIQDLKIILSRQDVKLSEVCDKVSDHDKQLKVPFEVRQKYFLDKKKD